MIRAILGLGNPGKEYADTRHNFGFRVADELAYRRGVRKYEQGRHCLFAQFDLEGFAVVAVRPFTYMNRSGLAWLEMAERFDIAAEHTLVVCDDLHLPLGKIRIRIKGSDGGHNGLASILQAAGTLEIPRMRLGIGASPQDWVDYVLSPFEADELALVDRVVPIAADALETFIRQGVIAAMDQYNQVVVTLE
ncbi:MAG TPA: aminoacyl-tRNA hydrolase [bacterium]|nr:aminoacyl-tRNA hydrolase [bacterium]